MEAGERLGGGDIAGGAPFGLGGAPVGLGGAPVGLGGAPTGSADPAADAARASALVGAPALAP